MARADRVVHEVGRRELCAPKRLRPPQPCERPTSFDYRFDPEHRILFGRVWGVWTMQDVNEFRARATSDPDFSGGMPQLVDLSEVTGVELSVREVIALGRTTPLGSGARRAYVAPSSTVYGMLRAYQATADETAANIRVFRSMVEARAWLGLD